MVGHGCVVISYNVKAVLQLFLVYELPLLSFLIWAYSHKLLINSSYSLATMSNGVAEGMPPRVSKQDIQEAEYSYMNNGNGNDFENALHRARTTGAVSLSADLFEKLYLSPKTEVKGELRATFGNPTPMCVVLTSSFPAYSLETCC